MECSRVESRASGEAENDYVYFFCIGSREFFDSSFSAHEENQRSTMESSLQEEKEKLQSLKQVHGVLDRTVEEGCVVAGSVL